jgi:hypothetical protein
MNWNSEKTEVLLLSILLIIILTCIEVALLIIIYFFIDVFNLLDYSTLDNLWNNLPKAVANCICFATASVIAAALWFGFKGE